MVPACNTRWGTLFGGEVKAKSVVGWEGSTLQQGAGALGEHPWSSAIQFWWSIICGVSIEQQQDLGKQDSTPAAAFIAAPVPSSTTNTITINF
jgi:hypothetical protein